MYSVIFLFARRFHLFQQQICFNTPPVVLEIANDKEMEEINESNDHDQGSLSEEDQILIFTSYFQILHGPSQIFDSFIINFVESSSSILLLHLKFLSLFYKIIVGKKLVTLYHEAN